MKSNALYFPYISVPNDEWTIKTLLYWDKLSSIVPIDFIDNPDLLGSFMQRLVQEELVEQVIPANHLDKIEDFDKCFINLVKQNIDKYRGTQNETAIIHREKLSEPAKIHAEKMGQIPDFLVQEGIALRNKHGWYEMNKEVANLFMAYVASCLGAIEEINASAVTNSAQFSRMFDDLSPSHKRRNAVHHSKARDVVLHHLLPVPDQKVTLDQLLRFKADHGSLLPPLRLKVEAHCAKVATLPNSEDRITATKDFLQESMCEVQEIREAMSPIWKKITFGSIVPLFGAGFTLLATPTSNKLAYAGGVLTLAGTAYQAISSIRTLQGNKKSLMNKPLAYVAHANSRIYA